MPSKRCPRCGETKPLNMFGNNKTTRDGLMCYCKVCSYKMVRRWKVAHLHPRPSYVPVKHKVCHCCHVDKPLEGFYRRKDRPDGHDFRCKECDDEKSRAYRRSDPDKIKEKIHKYYLTYKEKDIDRYLARGRIWKHNNHDKVMALSRRYRENNREAYRFRESNQQHKRRAAGGNFTAVEWEQMQKDYNYFCAYCGQKKKLTMDHIVPISKGGRHIGDNIVPACLSCNSQKWNDSLLMFLYKRKKREEQEMEYVLS